MCRSLLSILPDRLRWRGAPESLVEHPIALAHLPHALARIVPAYLDQLGREFGVATLGRRDETEPTAHELPEAQVPHEEGDPCDRERE
jgi:hypothetical protein